jgi:hypothetical protein
MTARMNAKNHAPTYCPVVCSAKSCEKIIVARLFVLKVIMVIVEDELFDIELDIPDILNVSYSLLQGGGFPENVFLFCRTKF